AMRSAWTAVRSTSRFFVDRRRIDGTGIPGKCRQPPSSAGTGKFGGREVNGSWPRARDEKKVAVSDSNTERLTESILTSERDADSSAVNCPLGVARNWFELVEMVALPVSFRKVHLELLAQAIEAHAEALGFGAESDAHVRRHVEAVAGHGEDAARSEPLAQRTRVAFATKPRKDGEASLRFHPGYLAGGRP